MAVADFDRDGRADLAAANFGGDDVSILLGQGNGGFAATTNFSVGTNPVSVAAEDLNAAGRPDLAVANFGSNDVSILLGHGNGAFGAATDFAVGAAPISVVVGAF